MEMTRRSFAQKGALMLASLVAVVTLPLTGCSAVADLENWIPVALSSVAAIVKLLGPLVPAPVAVIIATISAGFSALLTALQNYQKGTGVLSDITNAVAAVESAFANFFQSISVPTGLLNLIEGLAGILLSTLSAFAAKITGSAPVSASARVGASTVAYVPKMRSIHAYRKDWNSLCAAQGHSEAEI